jgi:hypothetical protein
MLAPGLQRSLRMTLSQGQVYQTSLPTESEEQRRILGKRI